MLSIYCEQTAETFVCVNSIIASHKLAIAVVQLEMVLLA